MPSFGSVSLSKLQNVHPDVVRVLQKAIERYDFSVLNGTRTVAEQQQNVAKHLSQTMNSMHIVQADGYGHAVDIAPFPQNWDDSSRPALSQFDVDTIFLNAFVMGVAHAMGVELRSGVDWNGDGRLVASGFRDTDHVELPVAKSDS